jgi:hypothetical protein
MAKMAIMTPRMRHLNWVSRSIPISAVRSAWCAVAGEADLDLFFEF